MTKEKPQFQLSAEAFTDLKQIVQETLGEDISDGKISEMGVRLLQLFSVFASEDVLVTRQVTKRPTLSQFNALKYVHNCIFHSKRRPTVRGISKAVGLHSSRSGFRMLNDLLDNGFLYRDEQGTIVMREDVAGCDTRMRDDSNRTIGPDLNKFPNGNIIVIWNQ